LEDQKLKQLTPDEVDTFDSSHVYLVEHSEHKQSSLYTWFEGAIYIWVGIAVEERKNALLSVLEKAGTIGTSSKTVRIAISIMIL
jgi:hypothetical protein